MDAGIVAATLSIIVLILLGLALSVNKKSRPASAGRSRANTRDRRVVDFAQHWQRVESLMEQPGLESTKAAIFEADKLIDQALQQRGVPGDTMGERLKSARQLFSSHQSLYQDVWQAHKTRNALAHELAFELPKGVATDHLKSFKEALQHLGVL